MHRASKCVVALDEPPNSFYSAVREITIYLARMHCTVCRTKSNKKPGSLFARGGPRTRAFAAHRVRTRMHQRLIGLVRKPYTTKKSSSMQVLGTGVRDAGMVILNAMTQLSGPEHERAHGLGRPEQSRVGQSTF